MNSEIRPQPLAMSQSVVDDLHDRLERTRWPDAETVEDDSQGVPLSRLRALAAYWRDEYDWRKTERRVNALDPSVTTIDGVDIHFLHVRSPEPDAVPLIITHGWPSTTLELVKAARQLADPRAHGQDPRDAYHVVLPSLPGFGLSGKPRHTGWAPERIAVAWLELMRRLGYAHDTYLASRRWVAERYPTLSYYNEAPRGGHFPAWEQPSLFADEVRASFRQSL